MMTEFEDFMATLDGKAEQTKKTYRIQYHRLRKLLNADIADVSQKKTIDIISQQPNPNQQQSSINIAVLIRRLRKLPTNELDAKRESNKIEVVKQVKKVNQDIVLPSLDTLYDYLEYLYADNQFTYFIINYLLLEFQVRNKDLLFKIVTRKKDMVDEDKNYIWLDLRTKKCLYTRRSYKTFNTYGEKTHVIKDNKFLVAIKRVLACQKFSEECGVFIPNENQVGYYIMRSTYKGIGEGAYLKVLINAYKNQGNLQKLKQMADNRGTNLNTLVSNYEIDLK